VAVTMRAKLQRLSCSVLLIAVGVSLATCVATAADPPQPAAAPNPQVPRPHEFPSAAAGEYIAGELVMSDPINRRGSLRLDGDRIEDKYDKGAILPFALLPYCEVWYQGAPADLCDIPFGTHLHGLFFLPPEGEEKTLQLHHCPQEYVPKQNHALLLEDDLSFHARRGRAWKIGKIKLVYDQSSPYYPPGGGLKIDGVRPPGDWRKTGLYGATLEATVVPSGKAVPGLPESTKFTVPQELTIDRSTRLWRGRESIGWEDLAPENEWKSANPQTKELAPADMVVQLALAWHATNWQQTFFHVSDIWLDEESRLVAAERQRQRHLRREIHYWLPGWVDHVDHEKNIVTVTLFGGRDRSLFSHLRPGMGIGIEPARKTLRTSHVNYGHQAGGPFVDVKDLPDPPVGSAGLQVRVQVNFLQEGFRPGRIVRIAPNAFPSSWPPPEWRANGADIRLDD
jgi:hypothetical protein